jgi:hypothetical protein
MSQQESKIIPTPLNVKFADASHLPIQHVNAMGLRSGSDEFFFTLGVIEPPDQEELPSILEVGHVIAQPVYRFAVSRDNMEKFLQLMANQFEQQTTVKNQLDRQKLEDRKEGD